MFCVVIFFKSSYTTMTVKHVYSWCSDIWTLSVTIETDNIEGAGSRSHPRLCTRIKTRSTHHWTTCSSLQRLSVALSSACYSAGKLLCLSAHAQASYTVVCLCGYLCVCLRFTTALVVTAAISTRKEKNKFDLHHRSYTILCMTYLEP